MKMNINLDDGLAEQLIQYCQNSGKTFGLVIQEAVEAWLANHQVQLQWSSSIANFKGIKNARPFESFRDELLPQ